MCTPLSCSIVKDIIVSCDVEFLPNNKNDLFSTTLLNGEKYSTNLNNDISSQVNSILDHSHLINAVRIFNSPYTETIDDVDRVNTLRLGGDTLRLGGDRGIGPGSGTDIDTEKVSCLMAKPIRIPIENLAFHNTKYDLIIGLATILELQLLRIYANKFSLGMLPGGEDLGLRDKSSLKRPRTETSGPPEAEFCSALIHPNKTSNDDAFEEFIKAQYAGEDEISPKDPALSWVKDRKDINNELDIPTNINGSPFLREQLRKLCEEYKDIFKHTLDGECSLTPISRR